MKIVFATNNKNKVIEVQNLLPDNIQLVNLSDIQCFEEIPETENTIEKNAIQKANYIKQNYQLDCFADDSGLEVEALNGAPGVYSARYAGEQKNNEDNIDKLLLELNGISNRNAQFKTVIALNINKAQYLFTGIVKGKITEYRRGTQGFGYDAVFEPEGYDKTFAEMTLQEKNKISHRAIATIQLVEFLINPLKFTEL
jgi:XTP/dITP diphosphohydrolase